MDFKCGLSKKTARTPKEKTTAKKMDKNA